MRRLILIFLLIIPFFSQASHIVGGEFELIFISGNTYRLNMILYFDLQNGNPGAKDLSAMVRIFRIRDNATMMDVTLPLVNEDAVLYSQEECTIGQLRTSKLTYSTKITLSANAFNDPQGYYVTWQRCCRNYTISNVYSDDPNSINPDPQAEGKYAGQTFYLEFPPVVKDGLPFIDSTPRLFPPLSDYACQGKPYYVDFGGTDDDGDSLVYKLVAPLNTLTQEALPPGGPIPKLPDDFGGYFYPTVIWQPTYDINHIMGGDPDLAISNEGFLTVTPTKTGLFVFAVKCEEFRDGVKIGEARRDFQMLSVVCKTAVPPVITGKKVADGTYSYRDFMNITFPYNTPQNERCIEVQISDQDINNSFDNFQEKIKIRAKGQTKSLQKITLPSNKSATLTLANPTTTFQICLDECPIQPNVPYQFNIIASDDACALPLLDTLRVTVLVQTPTNTPAYFIEPDPNVIESLNEGSTKDWPIKVVDDDGDHLNVSYLTDGFSLASVGMNFNSNFAQPIQGIVEDTLIWDAQCDKYDFSVKRNFHITMIADDDDFCSFNKPDTAKFNLTLIPPPNADPVIDTDLTPDHFERTVDGGSYRIFDKIKFKVFGHDDDTYPISLEAQGIGFQLIDYGMVFPAASGITNIESDFTWPLECTPFDLAKKDSFNIRFMVIDRNNWCKIYQADTVDVAFKILPPINAPPVITMQNLHPETNDGLNTATSVWGNPIEFQLIGTDADETPVVDHLKLEMIEATGNVEPTGYTFSPVSGVTPIETKFLWTPDCSIFKDNNFLNTYEFQFRVFDDHCESAAADTISLILNVKDLVSTDAAFLPPNVITPNEDNCNDFFAIDGFENALECPGTVRTIPFAAPLDNCINRFEYINIYDRWGKLMFTSTNRYFRWYAPHAGAGVYFYFLKFTNKDYKSTILVRY